MEPCARTRLNRSRRTGAVRTIIFICLIFVTGAAISDANDGEFLGYKLGTRLIIDDPSWVKVDRAFSVGGNPDAISIPPLFREDTGEPPEYGHIRQSGVSFYVAVEPVNKEFDEVLLLVTPISRTVMEIRGYIRTTENEYAGSLLEVPREQVAGRLAAYEARKDELFRESTEVARRFFEVLHNEYPTWEARKCEMLDEIFLFSCSLRGSKHLLYLNASKLVPLSRRQDYGEVEVIFYPLEDGVYELERKEKEQYIERLRAQALDDVDKTGL